MKSILQIWEFILPTLISLKDWVIWLLNSNFLAALAGALAGAVAADRIATKKTRREKIDGAVRDVNSAIMFAGIISNHALVLKSQHVLDFHRAFALEDVRFQEEAQRRQQGGAAPDEFRVQASLIELPELSVPVEPLASLVFNSLKLNGRPVGLMVAVQNALTDLNGSIRWHNEFCRAFKNIPEEEQAARYLGFPNDHVHDERYAHHVGHIYFKTNELAFFAAKICADLQEHGEKVAERWASEYRKEPPYINSIQFDTPLGRSLMPPEAQYADFLSMFQPVVRAAPETILRRVRNKICSWIGL